MTLTIDGVRHAYGEARVLHDVAAEVSAGEILCLLGPSGCGKSTLLRLVAGLEPMQAGRIAIGGETVGAPGLHVPPEQRGVGLVFQDFALFPHLDVLDNVAFGLREARSRRRERALEVLARIDMAEHAAAFPHMLSGGQQQRVALARALAPAPRVMLLDEPFSGLDTGLRSRLRDDTLHLLKSSGAATILVTHDPEEAMFMGDRIAVMDRGRVVQTGTPTELYLSPASAFVAGFFGEVNHIEATAQRGAVETPLGTLPANGLADGTKVEVLVRPEALVLAPAERLEGLAVAARVLAARMLGRTSLIHLEVATPSAPPLHLHSRMPGDFLPAEGTMVAVRLDRRRAYVFPAS